MEYIITSLEDDKRTVISRHRNLDEAMEAGKLAWRKAPKGVTISCINGNVNENGEIVGQYKLYESWI